jgi:hypothetical protein
MINPSPMAAAVTDSVRRSDARPLALSASGQSRSASCSRLCSRPVTASSASSAVAFLVSKVTGAPSRLTTGGPSRARLRSVVITVTVTYLREKHADGLDSRNDLVSPTF